MTILQYLSTRKNLLILTLPYFLINTTVLFLYNSATEPVLYALAIYLVFLFFLEILDYLHQAKKHKLLISYESLTDQALQELIPTHDILAKDYQHIIKTLEQQQIASTNSHLKREQDLSDFSRQHFCNEK